MAPMQQRTMSQIQGRAAVSSGQFDDNASDTESSPVFGMNSLKATAIQNFTNEFTVPMWNLLSDDLENHKPGTGTDNSFFLRNDGTKGARDIKTSVIGTDQRQKVDPANFGPTGKYRSVVKLSLIFRKNGADVKMMGTGWLIQPDLLVTAGHCVYDKSYNMGQVKSIVAYLGYQGTKSLNPDSMEYSDVETGYGKIVATTNGWIRNLGRQYDIAWVKLDQSFKKIGKGNKPIDWAHTPFQGSNSMLGVVGYPGDKELDGEYGAEMYECWMPSTYDLGKTNMIQYDIDTYGGQSGSPVFYSLNAASISMKTNAPYPKFTDLEANAIGVHTYGGRVNSGTPIGPFGNPMQRIIDVVNKHLKLTREIRYVPENAPESRVEIPLINGFDPVVSFDGEAFEVKVPFANEEFGFGDILSIGTKVLGGFFESGFEDPSITAKAALQDEASIEGFFDFLGKAAKTIGSVALPMVLGPAGVPASMVANAAITALGKSFQKKSSNAQIEENDSDSDTDKKQMYRAALADAVFDACCKHHQVLNEEGLFDSFKKWIPIGVKVATAVGSAFGEFAQDNSTATDTAWLKSKGYEWDIKDNNWQWDTQPVDTNTQPATPYDAVKNALPEGDHYSEFVKCMGASDYFPGIKWDLLKNFKGKSQQTFLTELAQQSPQNPLTDNMQIANTMRALTGEMVLSALEQASPAQLQTIGEEGFFTDVTATLKRLLSKFGDNLVKYGPQILDAINKIVQDNQGKTQGSAFAQNEKKLQNNGVANKQGKAQSEGATDNQEGTQSEAIPTDPGEPQTGADADKEGEA